MIKTKKLYTLLYTIICFIAIFQFHLIQFSSVFSYFDEIIAIISLFYIFAYVMRNKSIQRDVFRMLSYMVMIILIGLLSSSIRELQTDFTVVLQDVFYCFKVFIVIIGMSYFTSSIDKVRAINILAKVVQPLVIIAFVCSIVNQFVDIGMSSGSNLQFSIKTFAFVFSADGNAQPGVFSMYAYMYLVILSLKLQVDYVNIKRRKFDLICIVCCLVSLVATLQSRAFVFCLLYVVLYYIMIVKQKKLSDIKISSYIRPWHVILLGSIIFYLARFKLEYFFFSGNLARARYAFWYYAIITALRFFPLGSGFATFGTYNAYMNYSKLYTEYGMDKIYGLTRDNGSLASDGYWPAIIAQFGFIGAILMVLLVLTLFRFILKRSKGTSLSFHLGLFVCIVSGFSSLATSAFFHFTTIGLFIVSILNFGTADKDT